MRSERSGSPRRREICVRYGALGLGALAPALPLCAQAQETGLEEITVTARRVEENLQDTPLAVSVFTGDRLTERQVFETTELDQVVPHLRPPQAGRLERKRARWHSSSIAP